MKAFKKKALKQAVILVGTAGGLLFLSACSSTKVLEDRGEIPAPGLTPPSNANQLVTQELQTQPVITTPEQPEVIQTATNVPGFQEGTEGKVKYTVQKGDSLWKISKMFDVSVRELAAYNDMETTKHLKVGAVLKIPPSGLAAPRAISTVPSTTAGKHKTSTHAAAKKTNGTTHNNGEAVHIVKKGESLKTIAKKNGITVSQLLAANSGLNEKSKLKSGEKINIPSKSEKAAASTAKTSETATTTPEQNNKNVNELINTEAVSSKPAENTETAATAAPAEEPVASAAATATSAEQKPATAAAAPATPNYLPHTVKEGDTWQVISDMYGLSVDDLKKVNPAVEGEPKTGTTINIPEE